MPLEQEVDVEAVAKDFSDAQGDGTADDSHGNNSYNSGIGRIIRASKRRREHERAAATLASYNRHFNPYSPGYIGR